MMGRTAHLDEFLERQSGGVHRSHRRLANVVREAYPIGVPAMIMKSSTDRLGASAGYAFHLGTPDELLRRIASWLITEAGEQQDVLLKLIGGLWKRHGREDVALAALLLANIDHTLLGIDPWSTLATSVGPREPAEALLLSIEELLRAGKPMPSEGVLASWCGGRLVEAHLALITVYVGTVRGAMASHDVIMLLSGVQVPDGDSFLGRIKDKVVTREPQD